MPVYNIMLLLIPSNEWITLSESILCLVAVSTHIQFVAHFKKSKYYYTAQGLDICFNAFKSP